MSVIHRGETCFSNAQNRKMCQLSTRENGLNNTQRKKMFEYPKMRKMFRWSTEEKDVPVGYLQRRKFRRSIHGKKIFDRNFFYPQYPQEFFFALTIFASFCSNPNYRAARSSLQKKCYIIFILCKNLLKLKQCGPWLLVSTWMVDHSSVEVDAIVKNTVK